MEVAIRMDHRPAVTIIDISDDNDDDDDVSVVYETPKTSKGKGISTSDAISVEDYFERSKSIVANFCSKPSSSGTEKVVIDLSVENPDDEIQFLGSISRGRSSNSKCIDIDESECDENFTCDICADEKPVRGKFKIMGCNHSYCKQCMAKYVSSRLQENICRISCPVSGCKGLLEPYYCRSILPEGVFNRWGDALCEGMLLEFEKFYCPFKDCCAVLIDECRDGILGITESECPECRRLFCVKCKVGYHSGIVCEEFQKLHNDERGREDIELMQLAKNQEWQRCPSCRIYVARTEGCAQMKCRCGCTFCYKCGAKSSNHYCPSCGT